ncbi:MAG TPA: hypothetical protein PKE31_13520 [Pseudomonadota bacterium]|nr:hypothetical protein [Pseudomonadota bacterium]
MSEPAEKNSDQKHDGLLADDDDAKDMSDVPSDEDGDSARSLLSGLAPVSSPKDLSQKVPELIERRSRGRFFGRRRLHERIPFVWLSLVMLLVTALFYALLRMTPALFSSP